MRREKILPAIKRKTVTEIETGRLSQGEAALTVKCRQSNDSRLAVKVPK